MWTDICAGSNEHQNPAYTGNDDYYASVQENHYEDVKEKEPEHLYKGLIDDWRMSTVTP